MDSIDSTIVGRWLIAHPYVLLWYAYIFWALLAYSLAYSLACETRKAWKKWLALPPWTEQSWLPAIIPNVSPEQPREKRWTHWESARPLDGETCIAPGVYIWSPTRK